MPQCARAWANPVQGNYVLGKLMNIIRKTYPDRSHNVRDAVTDSSGNRRVHRSWNDNQQPTDPLCIPVPTMFRPPNLDVRQLTLVSAPRSYVAMTTASASLYHFVSA